MYLWKVNWILSCSYSNSIECLLRADLETQFQELAATRAERDSLKAQLAACQWISVEERLPMRGEDVLAFDGAGVQIAIYRPDKDAYRWDCDTYGLGPNEVTHWQAINPPKGA